MTPREQAEYRELTKFHQHQAEVNEKMTGMSKIIEERTKAWEPGLPADLIRQSIQVKPPERQELHRMTAEQKVWAFMKQDEIPRTDQQGTSKGYYLYIEDDAGCMIEQEDGRLIQDTNTEQ